MLDVYTSLSQVKMADLNFPLSFLTNAIRVQAPKIKHGIFVSNWCIVPWKGHQLVCKLHIETARACVPQANIY